MAGDVFQKSVSGLGELLLGQSGLRDMLTASTAYSTELCVHSGMSDYPERCRRTSAHKPSRSCITHEQCRWMALRIHRDTLHRQLCSLTKSSSLVSASQWPSMKYHKQSLLPRRLRPCLACSCGTFSREIVGSSRFQPVSSPFKTHCNTSPSRT